MNKRTIKPAAGDSRVSAAAAKSAARYVYRDRLTGKFVVSEQDLSVRRSSRTRVLKLNSRRAVAPLKKR